MTTLLLASIPSPGHSVWQLRPIPIRADALPAGILLAVWLGNRRWVARGGRTGDMDDVAVWAVQFGIVGAGSTTSSPTRSATSAQDAIQ